MIPLGVLASAHQSAAAERSKTVTVSSGTSISATFDEPTALDSTNLLVAFVLNAVAGSISAPAGWTDAGNGGAYGSVQQAVFARQGDGSTNGITVTIPSTTKAQLILLSFPGFVSATPLTTSSGTNNTGSGLSVAIAAPGSLPAGAGVMLTFLAANGTMQATRSHTNGFTTLYPAATSDNTLIGRKAYTGAGGSYSTTAAWSGGVLYERWATVVYSLT